MNRKLVVNDLTFKGVLLLAIISLGLLVGGCSWFAWLPGVGDGGSKDDEESSEPIKLEKFIAEADVRVIWKRGVGQGLGKKYVRLTPSVVEDRIVAAVVEVLHHAGDRGQVLRGAEDVTIGLKEVVGPRLRRRPQRRRDLVPRSRSGGLGHLTAAARP